MRKSIQALAALIAAGTLVQASAADARGFRVGFGFGGARQIADNSILERARLQVEKNNRHEAESMRRYNYPPIHQAPAIDRRKAAAASAAAAERRQAAAEAAREAARARADKLAAAQEAKRQARVAAQSQVQAASAKKAKTLVAKAPVDAPVLIARPATAPVETNPALSGDKKLDAAQEQQRAKAEELLKRLNQPAPRTTSVPEMPPMDTVPAAPAPARLVVAPSVTSEPARTQIIAPATEATPTKPAATPAGECRRFIPGAGVTVQVPCSE